MFNPIIKSIELSDNEFIKYSKQLILNNINIEGQKRIKNSKILIIGLGGLGNPIAIYLAASGIGHIGILDKDYIELSNLNRQIIYREIDLNCSKVILTKNKINTINSSCKVITHKYEINQKNSQEVIRYYDLVIDTTDNFDTRYIINEACKILHKTYVYGAVDQFIGQIGIFNYKDGIKYNNLYPKYLNLITQNCNINGVMGIATGYIGILQAIEVIKIITGNKHQLNNRIILCDLMKTQLKLKKVYGYRNHIDDNNKIKSKNLRSKIRINDKKDFIILIDIRDKKEFNKKHIQKSINIPLQAFKFYKTLNFIKKQATQKYFYIYCETLHKSTIVSSILKNNQINNHNILKNR
uniref:Molybdopterin biosynthesis protein n=1 Tax=Chondria sp. (in: red algae) TaxID=1982705 RepID=A0A1Z1MDE8_9FLOR|nr:Molybdopterin biosynthesis protein [Chondria sp. (in: red algae)]